MNNEITEEQIETVKRVIREVADIRPYAMTDDPHVTEQIVTEAVRAALTAAGVAPQEPSNGCSDDGCLHYDHRPAPSPDREKRGINLMRDLGYDESDPEVIQARADAAREDREKLIAELRRQAHSAALRHDDALSNTLWNAADVLAAQPKLNPEKVAEVIDKCGKWTEIEQLQIANYPNGWEATPAAQYIAGRLYEAHEKGELT